MTELETLVRRVLAGLALLLGLSPEPLPAQGSTVVVDASAGPGTDFVQLQTAIDAVGAGTTIFVRAGTYTAVTIHKGVRIVGSPGVVLAEGAPGTQGLRVDGLPAGEVCSVSDVVVGGPGSPSLTNNDGLVIFDSVSMAIWTVLDCAFVELNECDGRLFIARSTVSMYGHFAQFAASALDSFSAAILEDSTVSLANSTLEAASPPLTVFAGPAIELRNAALTVSLREPGHQIAAAAGSNSPAIIGTGLLVLDPVANLVGDGVPPTSVAIVVQRSVPTLEVTGGAVGQAIQLTARGLAGSAHLLLVGSPALPTIVPGLGGTYFLNNPGVLVAGSYDAQGIASFTLPVPALSALISLTIGFQDLASDGVGGLQLSNPRILSLRP